MMPRGDAIRELAVRYLAIARTYLPQDDGIMVAKLRTIAKRRAARILDVVLLVNLIPLIGAVAKIWYSNANIWEDDEIMVPKLWTLAKGLAAFINRVWPPVFLTKKTGGVQDMLALAS
jgi:hypothetical protein